MDLVRRVLRAGLMALLFAGLGVVTIQAPANACKCVAQTLKAQVKSADLVFAGTIASAKVKAQKATYEVDVTQIYRGQVPAPQVIVKANTSSAACGLGTLPPGRRMVFFVADGDPLRTTSCAGTTRATAPFVKKLQGLLGKGEAPAVDPSATPTPEPAPTSATRTPLDNSQPAALTELLVPAAALVLLGLLGLAIASWLRRRPA
jgi:hypothetical protein